MPFQQLGLHPSLVRNTRLLGYITPTPIQAQAIPAIQAGRDLIATAQTGTGKTGAFLLPVLHQLLEGTQGTPRSLVLTPTRELAQQIDTVFRGLAKGTTLRSAVVIGGAPIMGQLRTLRAGVDMIVATPGRLLDLLCNHQLRLSAIQTLILDEADQMFDMGFLPDLKRIIARLPVQRQNLLFSATMPPAIQQLGEAVLRDPLMIAIGQPGTTASSVRQTVYPVPAHLKASLLKHLLEELEMPSVLVFTRTKQGAKRLAKSIAADGHDVGELHSDRSPSQRARTLSAFRSGHFPVLVATNIAARGIDVSHITHVVNYDVPQVPEEYVHRIGRTGRASATGDAFVLVSPEEERYLARIERQLGKRIDRQRMTDFDYTVRAVKPTKSEVDRQPALAGAPADYGMFPRDRNKQKPSRGQGRR